MTLVRLITAKTLESIDFNNLGNHFTVEGNEPAIAMNLNHLSADASEGNIFYVYIETDSINNEATTISNENHPSEKEVVTNENSEVKVIEVLDEDFNVIASDFIANTGTRTHEWVNV